MTKARLIADSANDNSINGDRLSDNSIPNAKIEANINGQKLVTGSIPFDRLDPSGSLSSESVSYTAPETRTVQSKLGDIVSAKDFGAKGNGNPSEDDTAALQAAINAANGKTLYIPAGTYFVSNLSITAGNKPVVILADGATLSITGPGSGLKLLSPSGIASVDRIVIRGLGVTRFSSNTNTNLIGLDLDGGTGTGAVTRVTLDHCRITNFNTAGSKGLRTRRAFLCDFYGVECFENLVGLEIDQVTNANGFYNCRINNNDGDGVVFVGAGAAVANLFSACEFEANGGTGVSIAGGAWNTTFDTCYIEANQSYGIHVNSPLAINTHITNTFFFQSSGRPSSIYLETANRTQISGTFSSGDPNETNYAILALAGASDVILDQIWINGYQSGSFGVNVPASSFLISGSRGEFSSNVFRAGIGTASATAALYNFRGDENTGVGRSANKELALIANGSTIAKLNSSGLILSTSTPPASPTSTGTQGQIAWDANYFYVCTGSNSWKRVALSGAPW